jgi:hypothetical protein
MWLDVERAAVRLPVRLRRMWLPDAPVNVQVRGITELKAVKVVLDTRPAGEISTWLLEHRGVI